VCPDLSTYCTVGLHRIAVEAIPFVLISFVCLPAFFVIVGCFLQVRPVVFAPVTITRLITVTNHINFTWHIISLLFTQQTIKPITETARQRIYPHVNSLQTCSVISVTLVSFLLLQENPCRNSERSIRQHYLLSILSLR